MLVAARSSQDFACWERATERARSKCASAFATSGAGDISAISPAVRWISASQHFSLVVFAAVIASPTQRQASSNCPSSAWARADCANSRVRASTLSNNMLLHSRQGSGEHRPVDINALVDESLNLAYHGARAEKQGFNITLERSFDPAAGEVDLFPQEITRVLLNLISNGFYATTKRNAAANGGDYEPTLAAATKNLGDSVEIRIRDNGTGITPEVREKLFNPFFTTKPTGEGTGLGLSISHDIIVKQHSGSIEVDTRPGEFTEFRIVLPRAATSANKTGGGGGGA
jgi:signal transduction histidine kinase